MLYETLDGNPPLGDAVLYVTLESPAAHMVALHPVQKRSSMQASAKFISALPIPTPRVAGQGIQQLREAGIEVHSGKFWKAVPGLKFNLQSLDIQQFKSSTGRQSCYH